MSNYSDKLKEIVQKAGPVRILAVVISGILLLLLSYGNMFRTDEAPQTGQKEAETGQSADYEMKTYREQMETQVKEILEQAEGVGTAKVMITLKASKEKVTLKDSTVDGDKSGEESVLVEDAGKNTLPYVVQETEPEIEGILVVCSGGDRSAVQREIIAGISALFPIESHKIKVMKSKEVK